MPDAVYIPHGEGVQLFDWLDGTIPPKKVPREVMFEGRAGTGKTRMLCEFVKALCEIYPKSKGLILRETRVSLNHSVLDILENEVFGPEHPAVLGGPTREHRTAYSHAYLGGEIVLGGMDNPTKLFSTQYDWIWFNEMQETTESKWESLHRALRGSAHSRSTDRPLPFRLLLGDCNPDAWHHWANQRALSGKLYRIIGQFTDNPVFYSHADKNWTEEGREYLGRLGQNLTGVNRKRLYEGEWCAAEGIVWPDYDPGVHVIDAEISADGTGLYDLHVPGWPEGQRDVRLHRFLGGHDVGFRSPGCAQIWGFDEEGRAYRIVEIYRTGWDHDRWAEVWADLLREFHLEAILSDWDPAFQRSLNTRLWRRDAAPLVRPWSKRRGKYGEMTGIDAVRIRMRRRPDGTRGFYLLKNAHRHFPDPTLVADRKITCLEQEIPAFVFRKPPREGENVRPDQLDDPDPDCVDHAIDVTRAVLGWAEYKNLSPRKEPAKEWHPDSNAAHWMRMLRRKATLADPISRHRRRIEIPWKVHL